MGFSPLSHQRSDSLYVSTVGHSLSFQITDSSVTKVILETIILNLGTPLKLHSDQGSHLPGQAFQQVRSIWPGLHHFHCAYNSQSSGLVKHINTIINSQMAKFIKALQIL